jgi:hypothetical protein
LRRKGEELGKNGRRGGKSGGKKQFIFSNKKVIELQEPEDVTLSKTDTFHELFPI